MTLTFLLRGILIELSPDSKVDPELKFNSKFSNLKMEFTKY